MPMRWIVALSVAIILGPAAAYAQQTDDPVGTAGPAALKVDPGQDSSADAEGFVAKMRRIADEYQLEARLNGDIDGWYPGSAG